MVVLGGYPRTQYDAADEDVEAEGGWSCRGYDDTGPDATIMTCLSLPLVSVRRNCKLRKSMHRCGCIAGRGRCLAHGCMHARYVCYMHVLKDVHETHSTRSGYVVLIQLQIITGISLQLASLGCTPFLGKLSIRSLFLIAYLVFNGTVTVEAGV